MTSTVGELIENLKDYPAETVLAVKDVDDVEFAITDFKSFDDGVTIIIGSKVDEEPDEEEE
ncbi:MAG: hypothetical protein V7L21_26320 [Nostoc sp.]|uniref:hypothetical protein n=1 Tax=unclassified Nostoc TaxID=2593658 RepID=UPI0025E62308|nr:hypothetical protein [Nostoc sp. NMS9]MBN3942996.1 hypothetical protein [Nostoc sp. NMS9]